MLALLRLLFALSFELKTARINTDNLISERSLVAVVSAQLEKKKTPLMEAGERYTLVDLNDTILSNDVLVDYLIRGIVDPKQIQACLEASRFFVTVADEDPWRTVWHWSERTEKEWESAFRKMEAQYAAREFTLPGEMLHVLGLRLFLSNVGLLKGSPSEIVEDGKRYIDDLYENNKLKPSPADDFSSIRLNAYGGLGIHEHESEEYKELYAYLKQIDLTWPAPGLDDTDLSESCLPLELHRA